MWESFHQLRTHSDFMKRWQQFLTASIDSKSTPILYQNISDRLFRILLKQKLCVTTKPADTAYAPTLTYEEQNALRYAAGYIPRALRKKLDQSGHEHKVELILCLTELTEDEEESPYESKDWEKVVDRGGLIHVNHNVFMLVTSMELQLLKQFRRIECGEDVNLRQSAIPLILADNDVQFYWSIISASWEQEVHKALLSMIADLWITICGFAYANGWVERHKRETKTCVQKTKGVRKHLLSNPNK